MASTLDCGPAQQTVRVKGIGADLHRIEVEPDAAFKAKVRQHLMCAVNGSLTSEFRSQMGLVIDAFRRNVRIELVGPPVDLDGDLAFKIGDRLLDACLAEIAPGTDNIGDDVDGDAVHDGSFHSGHWSART